MSSSELEVIERAAQGDEAAQRSLYETHWPGALRLGYLLLGSMEDAEEVAQDAFVYAFRNLHRFDERRGSFWVWLRLILVSRCRNKRRRQHRPMVSLDALEREGSEELDGHLSGNPSVWLEEQTARRALWAALQKVSVGARAALVLRYYEGLPYDQIAEILGCTPEAARARVAHGKVQLRRLLLGTADTSAACTVGLTEEASAG